MKKIISLLVLTILGLQLATAGEVITQDVTKLPKKSQSFIKEHFEGVEILQIKIDSKWYGSKEYDVYFNNGGKIEFNGDGTWQDIDFKQNKVPNSVVPKKILNYVTNKFPQNHISQIEKEKKGYDVELNNDMNLKFKLTGDFLRLDD